MERQARIAVLVSMVVGAAVSLTHASGPRKDVSTIEALYEAVNDPANRDATIHLAPGTYVLSPTLSIATKGALKLQPGMTLMGSAVRADTDGDGVPDEISPTTADTYAEAGTATIIDGSALPPDTKLRTDCADGFTRLDDPIVRLGRKTSVSRLTILAGAQIAIGEPAELDEPGAGVSGEISDVVLRSSKTAATFSNTGCSSRSARSSLQFTRNVVRGDGVGLNISNLRTGDAFDPTDDGPDIDARVTFSRFVGSTGLTGGNGNGILVRAGAIGTDGGRLAIESIGNVFIGNGTDIVALGAAGNGADAAVGNQLRFTSRHDTFGPSINSAIEVFGGRRTNLTLGEPRGNRVDALISHARFIQSASSSHELKIVGGENGSDNYVVALVTQSDVVTSAGLPATGRIVVNESNPTSLANTVWLTGSPESFARTNPGFTAPAAEFFVPVPRR